EHIWMADDIFGLNKKWMAEFYDAVAALHITIPYKIQSRADLLVQENYINQLKATGCAEVWIGAESGSQKILDAMDKGITISQIQKATQLLQSKCIRVGYFLQFGYIKENLDDIKATVKMLLSNMPDDIGISVSYPLPGTHFYEKVKSQLGSKQNWKDSDDLDMMYQAPFSPAFYKRLHRLVHKLFRLKQGWLNLLYLVKGKKKLNWNVLKSIASILYYLPAAAADRLKLLRLYTPA
ncbi:MAG: radical SAM protein, partial [Saprospiraceae bacterium]|nr:radical SAM protein [Saprospiraceae bacterium]